MIYWGGNAVLFFFPKWLYAQFCFVTMTKKLLCIFCFVNAVDRYEASESVIFFNKNFPPPFPNKRRRKYILMSVVSNIVRSTVKPRLVLCCLIHIFDFDCACMRLYMSFCARVYLLYMKKCWLSLCSKIPFDTMFVTWCYCSCYFFLLQFDFFYFFLFLGHDSSRSQCCNFVSNLLITRCRNSYWT